jgi:hypothetical protein
MPKAEPITCGLTAKEEAALLDMLNKLHSVNRRAYLGGAERYKIDVAIQSITHGSILLQLTSCCSRVGRSLSSYRR